MSQREQNDPMKERRDMPGTQPGQKPHPGGQSQPGGQKPKPHEQEHDWGKKQDKAR